MPVLLAWTSLSGTLVGAQPHVVRFKECFLTADYLAIVMEYAAGGDMYRYVISRYAVTGLWDHVGHKSKQASYTVTESTTMHRLVCRAEVGVAHIKVGNKPQFEVMLQRMRPPLTLT